MLKNTSNNEMGMENYFYNEQIKKDLKKLKDSQKSFTYLKSPEYNDLQLVLTQFSKSKVNPIFIIPPVNKNGWTMLVYERICTNKRCRRFATS